MLLQLEAKLAAAEGDKAAAIADSERQRLEAVATAAAARERSEAAEAELEELRSAMDRSIAAAREEALGAMDTVGGSMSPVRILELLSVRGVLAV